MNESSVGKNINANNKSTIKPPPNLNLLFKQLHSITIELNMKNPENFINCKNLDTDRIQNMEIEPNSLFLFQVNFCFISKNSEDLEYLPKGTSKYFDVIVISE